MSVISQKKTKAVAEFGDFQTPDTLAFQVAEVLSRLNINPKSIIEPTCGRGAFLGAAALKFQDAELIGLDVNAEYLDAARSRLAGRDKVTLINASFFHHDWDALLKTLPVPLLVLGNPPWITNSELGMLGGDNLPIKGNFQNMKGLDAVTGKSNFDISEWMLLRNVEWLRLKTGALAVLCKTAVARKIVAAVWKRRFPLTEAHIFKIDAFANFGVSVDACLFVLKIGAEATCSECSVYECLENESPSSRFGYAENSLVADIELYRRYGNVRGNSAPFVWRSGIKHDCAKVMELTQTPDGLLNGYGERIEIEDAFLHPLIKSSDIAGNGERRDPKFVLVTQRVIGEQTKAIQKSAPLTWDYLCKHRHALQSRGSIIYRGKPEFSIFGVGDYSFAPWKIAISGLYKKLIFRLYGSEDGKPVMFDDTVYFLSFDTHCEARSVLALLTSDAATGFYQSMIFWDEKRPITAEILRRGDIGKLASLAGVTDSLASLNREARVAAAQYALAL